MRKILLSIMTVCIIILIAHAAFSQVKVAQVQMQRGQQFAGYVDNAIVVNFDRGTLKQVNKNLLATGRTGIADFDALAEKFGAQKIRQQFPKARTRRYRGKTIDLSGWHKVYFGGKIDAQAVAAAFQALGGVVEAQPIGIHAITLTPNDPRYTDQWHLNQANDADVDAPEAWDIEDGSTSIIVGITDTGVRYFHKDLGGANASISNILGTQGNIWMNSGEIGTDSGGNDKRTNGVDDDSNGYIDDWLGYDFIDGVSGEPGEDNNVKDNDPRDRNGHGTHVAGIVGAMTNNGYAVAGIAGGNHGGSNTTNGNGVKLMPLRIGYNWFFGLGFVTMDAAAEAFQYAADNGARILNASWGSSNTGGFGAAVDYFLASGGLIFHAAGNDNADSPDFLDLHSDPNIISVASTDETDHKSDFSNFGTWVEISAPGSNIWSTYHNSSDENNDYVASLSGTSMASPLAAGVAALIWSHHPSWTAAQVRQRLYDTADDLDALNPAYAGKLGAGRVNAFSAVNDGGPTPPAAPSNLTATTVSSSQIDLAWTDNANDEDGFKIERKTGAGAFTEIAQVGANVTSFNDTGLNPNTTYTYRVRAFNTAGNSAYSNEASATTQDVPPAAPTNLTATTVSSSQIDLAWTDNANNEDGFKIERKTGAGAFAEIAQVGANITSYNDTGLSPSTTYTYRVRAFNTAGNSAYSNEASATTQSQPQPPAAPTNLTATAVSTSQIDLAWTDNANNEDGFKIERKTGAGAFSEIAQVGADVTSYNDTGLSPSTTYTYRVRAFNTAGNSAYSNEASATTQSPPPPAAPTNLTATAVSTSQIDLSWTDNANNEDGFKIERKTGAGAFAEIAQVGANVTSYNDTGLSPSTTYTYRVRAFNTAGNSAYSNEASATTQSQPQPPAAPTNLTANAVSTSQIDLAWTDNANNEDGFKIERKTGAGAFSEIAQVGADVTSYNDTGLSPSTTYTYRVRAFNTAGNSAYSNEASATTQAGNQPPTATIIQPVDGKTYPRGQNLCYYGEADDPEDGPLPASQFEWRADLPNGVTDYPVATGVKFGQANPTLAGGYTLKLIVTDFDGAQTITTIQFTASNNAPANQPPTAVAQATPTSGTAPLAVNFNADNSTDPDGALRYEWDFGDGNTSDQKNPTHTYTNPGTYTAVLTVTDDNCATDTDQVTITVNSTPTPPAAPTNLTATAVSTSQIDLSWTDNANNEDGFKIERKTGAGAFAEIAQVGANVTSFNDTGLSPSTTYTYRVRAFNTAGNSAYSNEASATTHNPPQPPAAPTNLTATTVSSSQIDLAWTDNANNEDGFKIERKTGAGAFAEIAQVGANVTSYNDTGLSPSTTYTYRVRAFNTAGNSAYSNEASATTQTQPQPPAAPTNLTATAVSSSQIDLAWTDNANNEDGFKIERKTGAGAFAEIAQVGANVTSYNDTGLSPSTTYTYRVRAFNTAGNSAYSNEASATTQAEPPAAPSNLTATAVSTSQIDLAWTDNATNEDGFKIERKTGAGSFAEIAQVGANVTSYNDTGLSPSTTYTYRVRAFNAAGNSAYSNEASATTQSPPNQAPTATITQPADGSTHPVGQPINYAGDGTDPEDGVLPASAFTWEVDLPGGNTITLATGVKSGSATPTAPGDYTLRLIVEDSGGLTGTDEIIVHVVVAKGVAANADADMLTAGRIPKGYQLFDAFPNPFNPETRLRFALPETETVRLRVVNVMGKVVRTLIDNVQHAPGTYTYRWDGRDDQGQHLPTGIYFLHIEAGKFSMARKLNLVK